MLERNFLSHVHLVLYLFLLSASALLGTRLPAPAEAGSSLGGLGSASLPASIAQIVAAFLTLAAGMWEYHTSFRALRNMRAFFRGSNIHLFLMTGVTAIIIGVSVVYILECMSMMHSMANSQ